MKFIHAADLHLDSPFQGLKTASDQLWQVIHDSPFVAFKRLVDDAIRFQVDFICLVGDLYDQTTQSIQVQAFLVNQFKRLQVEKIPVYLSYGNHDFLASDSVKLDFPANVHVFPGEGATFTLITAAGEKVALSGFSYTNRWVTKDMTSLFPVKGQVDYQIGLLHGSESSVASEHAVYAPFNLSELLSKNYDYWALGHIHKRQVLKQDPPIVYSGNIQGRHKKESGEKGYYLVTTSADRQLNLEFHPVEVIEWRQIVVSVKQVVRLNTIINLIEEQVAKLPQAHHLLLSIQLSDSNQLSPALLKRIQAGELLEYLQQQSPAQPYLRYIYELKLVNNVIPNFQSLDTQYWQKAADLIFNEESLQELAGSLLQYPFLDTLIKQADFQAELKNDVLTLLDEINQNGVASDED
ncbi:metallophosphoesterase family protein [Loigolactobacillus backii]|uniref:Metallophosphoesterase n=1 Tax=Loigolactobacillus backii TaxID=375175 RepID=A0A192H344_9LACO|nr:exonuclease SbcCD subunit D [Loigolactobacillus backii]ANK59280.1 metallophosphoesterase [Loigolactobacillus backii]ANK62693.1 metallophosphoesterase [Loigolactobacillus backii]ANK64272.1 metallophosphoesterase [Loigolactobacillus backii]ANK67334.1 metallophosphoesterase [Loigolactobacillus backii]ANK70299.1 metallophosphoesterase [Loigolactobacillus backii]